MRIIQLLTAVGCILFLLISCKDRQINSTTVPIILDHNRMLVDAKIQRKDGSWRQVRLWVDSGNPDFFISEPLARDLGIDLPGAGEEMINGPIEVAPPTSVRISGMELNFEGVRSLVMLQPFWLFSAAHNDANLPSTVLKNYQVIFDYPGMKFTIAESGLLKPVGEKVAVNIHPHTGIVQINAIIGGENLSLALDNGASYSFISENIFKKIAERNPGWPNMKGTLGCANMWGWWPSQEATIPVIRLPEILLGSVHSINTGLVGVPDFSPNGPSLGEWYSQKTALPVDGFLGCNAFKSFRVEIDYVNNSVYFEGSADPNMFDMDMVGLTIRPEADGGYTVIGIAEIYGKPAVEDVQAGDKLFKIDELKTTGKTMGTVVDALRGKPGDIHTLILKRNGKQFTVEARVERFLAGK